MIKSIREHLFENKTEKSYTMKDVGSGYGKLIGGLLGAGAGGLPGQYAGSALGHYIGKKSVEKPDKPINVKSRAHRLGAMASEEMNAKRIAAGAASGAGAGLAGLALAPEELKDKIATLATENPALAGALAALPIAIGSGVAAAVGRVKAAKKLGYGKLGKTSAAIGLGDLTALTTPKSQRK